MNKAILTIIGILLIICIIPDVNASVDGEIHPMLCFNSSEVSSLNSKVLRSPYDNWYNSVKTRADSGLLLDLSSESLTETQRADYAKSLAFTYIIEDNALYADKAVEALLNSYRGSGGSTWLGRADTLTAYSQAYDIVADYSGFNISTQAAIRDRVANEAYQFYVNLGDDTKIYANNWRIKAASALGMSALAMPNYSHSTYGTASEWLTVAVGNLTYVWDDELSDDGIYLEGAQYAEYSNEEFYPFANAYYRAKGINIIDSNPKIQNMTLWIIKTRTPNGNRYPFGTSCYEWRTYERMITNPTFSYAGYYMWDRTSGAYSTPSSSNDFKGLTERG